ncbi:ferredoxin [Mycobacterium sp. URHB0021]|jgi:ferredoxin
MSDDAEKDVAVIEAEEVVIELDGRTTIATYRAGNTLLQTARLAGLQPPYSCQPGPAERVSHASSRAAPGC